AVERVVERDLLEAGAVEAHEINIEIPPLRIVDVRREDQALVVDGPRRREVGATELGDLRQVAAVGIHDEELVRRRTPQPFLQERAILVELLARRQRTATER